jgi:hypothetical protein
MDDQTKRPMDVFLGEIAAMLPAYDDPDWETRPDDLRCDVASVKQVLENFLEGKQ